MSGESKLPKDIEERLAQGYASGAGIVVHPSNLRTVVDVLEDDVTDLRERLRAAEERVRELEAEAVKLRVDHASWCLERKELIARHGELADRALVAEHDLRAAEERVRELEAALGKQWREGYDDGYGSALTDGAELRAVAEAAREYVLGEDDDGDFGRLLRLESRLAALDAAKRGTP